MLRLARKAGRLLLYGGFGGPRPYESDVLEATVAALPEADAEALRRQIGHIERLQRWNDDRMVIVGFEDKGVLPRLRNESTDHCLAKLRLAGSFGSITATVMTHRGILSSLEFGQSPRKLQGHDWSLEPTRIRADEPRMSSAIDDEEHGEPR